MKRDREQERTAELIRLGAATLLEAQGNSGALDPAIKPIHPSMKLAGPSLTVHCPAGDNLMIHHALELIRPGDVLVVDAEGFTDAGPWGDILSTAAQSRGAAGLIIDGAIRDSEAIIGLNFPVFARGICIRGTTKSKLGSVREEISCGGVRIRQSDYVVGDRDGVVAIEQEGIDAVIRLAIEREQKEHTFRKAVQAGASTVQLLGLEPLSSLGNQ